LLLRDTARLGLPDFTETRAYPMAPPSPTGSVNIFDPNLQVPYAKTWTAGYQRAVTRTTAMEVRYIGTHNYDGWTEYDYNEININENGLLEEFKLAQANLQANIAAGRGSNFRYYGPGTGTSPLPIALAYFAGLSQGQAGDPSKYSSSNFSSNTFLTPLAKFNPNPFTFATNLDADAGRRSNAIKAGLPANFLVANPDMLGGANITGNGGFTKYNGMQLELRRRMSKGLQYLVNYAYGKSWGSTRYSFRRDRLPTRQTGGEGGINHALKANWVYELPFGQGKRFGSGAGGGLNRVIGGWSFYGTARLQTGRLLDFGNVRLVGMSEKEFVNMFKLRTVPDTDGILRAWMLPDDVLDNTVKAFNVSATSASGYGSLGAPTGKYLAPANSTGCIESVANGYGDCGVRSLVVTGPMFARFDFSVAKQIPIKGRFNMELRAEVYNVLNRTNFTPVTGENPDVDRDYSIRDEYEVTGADTARYSQIAIRFNW
jgi:hypothetical protein